MSENKFQLDKGDYNNFRKYLDINWDDAMKTYNSVDDMWEYFKQILLTGMNEFIPRSKHSSKNSKKKFQSFTSELKNITHKNTDFGNCGFQLRIRQYLKNIYKSLESC